MGRRWIFCVGRGVLIGARRRWVILKLNFYSCHFLAVPNLHFLAGSIFMTILSWFFGKIKFGRCCCQFLASQFYCQCVGQFLTCQFCIVSASFWQNVGRLCFSLSVLQFTANIKKSQKCIKLSGNVKKSIEIKISLTSSSRSLG